MAKTFSDYKLALLRPPKPYYPSLPETREWYSLLNRRLFGNILPHKIGFELRELKDIWGKTVWTESGPKNTFVIELCLRYKNMRMYFETLSHEMGHVAQVIEGGEMNHGPSFFKWRPIFEENFLNLTKRD